MPGVATGAPGTEGEDMAERLLVFAVALFLALYYAQLGRFIGRAITRKK
jgi:hypothetical protein